VRIVEQFDTLQGEGKYLGIPSHFIRTTGCNLRCAWENPDGSVTKCDTPYTSWNPEKGEKLNLEDTLNHLADGNIEHVVITGGEPMLQPDIADVVQLLSGEGYIVTVETNGTIYKEGLSQAFMSISPKLRSSYAATGKEKEIHMKNNDFSETLKKWVGVGNRNYQIKFVVNTETDLTQIRIYQEMWKDVPAKQIWLMPQGITSEQFEENTKRIFDYCVDQGVNYSPRMHIDMFGNKRGV